MNTQRKPRRDYGDYLQACTIEAEKQWAYAGLVDDHADRVQQAYDLGEAPAEFIKWLGEKYDLISVADWNGF